MSALEDARRRFAEELRTTAGITSDRLIAAFATVPRERFLGPGPWTFRGEGSFAPQVTADADPRHVFQNVSIAVDPGRDLYNGQPGTVAAWIESLAIQPGDRALHIGCATGYYSAIIAAMVDRFGPRAASPLDVIETPWWKEEWTRGCSMAHWAPGILTRYGSLLREPFGRVHWAGTETAAMSYGTIDGAVRSGERAAAAILAE